MNGAFLEELASAAPTPGGGGASAYVGALASALASMVGNLTVGKARYEDVRPEVEGSLGRLAAIRERLLQLVSADADAFTPLARAYKMPDDTPDQIVSKSLAMQSALIDACEVPLDIMENCIEVLHECEFMARNGSKMALSDAGVAALFAKAALLGASLNVYINLQSMTDESLVVRYRSRADELCANGQELADSIYEYVASKLGATALW